MNFTIALDNEHVTCNVAFISYIPFIADYVGDDLAEFTADERDPIRVPITKLQWAVIVECIEYHIAGRDPIAGVPIPLVELLRVADYLRMHWLIEFIYGVAYNRLDTAPRPPNGQTLTEVEWHTMRTLNWLYPTNDNKPRNYHIHNARMLFVFVKTLVPEAEYDFEGNPTAAMLKALSDAGISTTIAYDWLARVSVASSPTNEEIDSLIRLVIYDYDPPVREDEGGRLTPEMTPADARKLFGPPELWDLSEVTCLSGAFRSGRYFATDITWWDVSEVMDMSNMFHGSTFFNQPIGRWNVSRVGDMSYMFAGAASFNQPLDAWNTSNVINMYGMFYGAVAFNQPLETWDTGNVTNMHKMFMRCAAFNQPLNKWNTDKVKNMSEMFWFAVSFNQPLDKWNTAQVRDMSFMFSNAAAFNQSLTRWVLSCVESTEGMFSYATAFNGRIGKWSMPQLHNAERMFAGAEAFNQALFWHVPKLRTATDMFLGADNFLGIGLSTWKVDDLCTTNTTMMRLAKEIRMNHEFCGRISNNKRCRFAISKKRRRIV